MQLNTRTWGVAAVDQSSSSSPNSRWRGDPKGLPEKKGSSKISPRFSPDRLGSSKEWLSLRMKKTASSTKKGLKNLTRGLFSSVGENQLVESSENLAESQGEDKPLQDLVASDEMIGELPEEISDKATKILGTPQPLKKSSPLQEPRRSKSPKLGKSEPSLPIGLSKDKRRSGEHSVNQEEVSVLMAERSSSSKRGFVTYKPEQKRISQNDQMYEGTENPQQKHVEAFPEKKDWKIGTPTLQSRRQRLLSKKSSRDELAQSREREMKEENTSDSDPGSVKKKGWTLGSSVLSRGEKSESFQRESASEVSQTGEEGSGALEFGNLEGVESKKALWKTPSSLPRKRKSLTKADCADDKERSETEEEESEDDVIFLSMPEN